MEKLRRNIGEKGITLVALVITIIVLLILAGISISMLSGDNSMLSRAGEARDKTEVAKEKELIQMAYNAIMIRKITNNDNSKITVYEVLKEINDKTYTSKYVFKDNGTKYENAIKKGDRLYQISNGKVEIIIGEEYFRYSVNITKPSITTVDENGVTHAFLPGEVRIVPNKAYYYERGMTWKEYINSDYNNSLHVFKKDSDEKVYMNYVYDGETYETYAVDKNNNIVKINDTINNEERYTFKYP